MKKNFDLIANPIFQQVSAMVIYRNHHGWDSAARDDLPIPYHSQLQSWMTGYSAVNAIGVLKGYSELRLSDLDTIVRPPERLKALRFLVELGILEQKEDHKGRTVWELSRKDGD